MGLGFNQSYIAVDRGGYVESSYHRESEFCAKWLDEMRSLGLSIWVVDTPYAKLVIGTCIAKPPPRPDSPIGSKATNLSPGERC